MQVLQYLAVLWAASAVSALNTEERLARKLGSGPTLTSESKCLGTGTSNVQVNCCNDNTPCDAETLTGTPKFVCAAPNSCQGSTFKGSTTRGVCAAANSCKSTTILTGAILNCAADGACTGAWFKGTGKIACNVPGGCGGSTFQGGRQVVCSKGMTCNNVNVGPGSNMACNATNSCNVLYIWGSNGSIQCPGERSCAGTTVTANEGATLACSGTSSCKDSVIGCHFQSFSCSSIRTNIQCTGTDACDGADFYGDFTTVTCAAGACTGATFSDKTCCKGAGCPTGAPACA
eukprot:TRINITY_DN3738_c0_g2_i7.p1 TRINITY_DN3738_c0_g2~~TRINITY_DN3738_c0_g2_i7.p1  ORF type:complete len:289 (-),score=21.17 TRINITY_DN3738_c0_g2_i7:1275-2141(-)